MRTLLYIEDNDDNLYMLQLRFDVLGGYEIISATDGAAGLAMAAAERLTEPVPPASPNVIRPKKFFRSVN